MCIHRHAHAWFKSFKVDFIFLEQFQVHSKIEWEAESCITSVCFPPPCPTSPTNSITHTPTPRVGHMIPLMNLH